MAKTVLIVDDVAFVRQTLAQILGKAGYQIVGEAEDGSEALTLFEQLRPDVVTMDVVMPRMSGIEATRSIMERHSDAQVIMISAMGQESLLMEAINAGARDFLLKPFRAEDVVKTIDRVTGGAEGERVSRRENKPL